MLICVRLVLLCVGVRYCVYLLLCAEYCGERLVIVCVGMVLSAGVVIACCGLF